MAKLSKNRKESLTKIDTEKSYSVAEAAQMVKENSTEKFDASIDIAVRLGVDPKQANQMVRGVVALPHGTGKDLKVLATYNNQPVMVTDGRHYVCSFHPEIGSDFRIHEYILKQVNA